MPGQSEFHTDILGSSVHRWSLGGVGSLRRRVSRPFSIRPASFSGINSRRLSRDAVPSGTVGLQASRVALYLTWSTRRYRRGAVLSGPSVGQPQPLLYRIAHGLKVVGGVTGGVLASRRKTPGLRSL
jgi:hypothetical protein